MDVIALLDQFARDSNPPRGDEQLRHVSDLAGCDRATWARFRNLLGGYDADTLRKFGMGFDVENRVLTAIGRYAPDLVLGANVAMSIGFDGIEGRIVGDDYAPRSDEIVGHPDGILDGAIIECKSTEFMTDRQSYTRIVPVTREQLQHHYKLQSGAYALALGKLRAVVIIQCRASGAITAISFDPREFEAEITQRIRAVLAISAGGNMPEPTLHPSTLNKAGQSWLCKYCLFPRPRNGQPGCILNRHAPPEVAGRESIDL